MRIVVAIPCYNEAITIQKVVKDYQAALPEAEVHVFDNNSKDESVRLAEETGAEVHHVYQQGKGYVVQAMFRQFVDADALIMIDGDDTYFPEDARDLLQPVLDGKADMVVGNRLPSANDHSMVRLHQIGNWLIVTAINRMFNSPFNDILSGYRVFSKRFMQTVPVMSAGFEVETELTIQALEEELLVVELPISYRSRPEGSESKLSSFRDGYRIITTAMSMLRDHRPMVLYGGVSLISFLIAAGAGVLRILNYMEITALPDALVTGIILLFAPVGVMVFGIGLMLHTVNTRMRQLKQIIQRNQNQNE